MSRISSYHRILLLQLTHDATTGRVQAIIKKFYINDCGKRWISRHRHLQNLLRRDQTTCSPKQKQTGQGKTHSWLSPESMRVWPCCRSYGAAWRHDSHPRLPKNLLGSGKSVKKPCGGCESITFVID